MASEWSGVHATSARRLGGRRLLPTCLSKMGKNNPLTGVSACQEGYFVFVSLDRKLLVCYNWLRCTILFK
jgi:hypothetical protein